MLMVCQALYSCYCIQFTQCPEVSPIPVLHMKKLRLRMVQQLAQGHRKLLAESSLLFMIFGQTLQFTYSLLTQATEIQGPSSFYHT